MFSFQFQPVSRPEMNWIQRPKAWRRRGVAEREATKFAEIMAGLGGHVRTRIVELQDDGRCGKMPVPTNNEAKP